MRVSELIDALSKLDSDAQVRVNGFNVEGVEVYTPGKWDAVRFLFIGGKGQLSQYQPTASGYHSLLSYEERLARPHIWSDDDKDREDNTPKPKKSKTYDPFASISKEVKKSARRANARRARLAKQGVKVLF